MLYSVSHALGTSHVPNCDEKIHWKKCTEKTNPKQVLRQCNSLHCIDAQRWEWEVGRQTERWATYVNLSDRYVNNATHNYQGIKCVPCINKIMLRWVEETNKQTKKQTNKERKKRKWKERKQQKEKRERSERKQLYMNFCDQRKVEREEGHWLKTKWQLKFEKREEIKGAKSKMMERRKRRPVMLVHVGKTTTSINNNNNKITTKTIHLNKRIVEFLWLVSVSC